MESSTPPASSADDSNAQDPLALPNTNDMYANESNGHCETPDNEGAYPSNNHLKHEEHPEQRLQYDAGHQMVAGSFDPQKMQQNHMSMLEPHKTFSHSIENLSKTTEKCAPNDMKM